MSILTVENMTARKRQQWKPGLYDIPAAEYHADPCPVPSLSSGLAKCLLEKSPRHAWVSSRRLNPNREETKKRIFDLGHAAHEVILGDPAGKIRVIDPARYPAKNGNIPEGYTNDAIREARDSLYESGNIPLLPWEHKDVLAMAAELRKDLANHEDASLAFLPGHGKPEQSIFWQERGVWCRILLDWNPKALDLWPDLKTTGGSAKPESWADRDLWNIGAFLQAAFYRRGIRAVLGVAEPKFCFVVVENYEPYASSVIHLSPRAIELADQQLDIAIDTWHRCVVSNEWPKYGNKSYMAEVPPYIEAKHMALMIGADS